jgi:hypothetical protein
MKEIFESFLKRYDLHPLLILRTLESTKTLGSAFDVLEDVSPKKSCCWDQKKECWAEKRLDEETFTKKKWKKI